MNKVRITKEYVWDMAHMLSGHKGLCQNVHGHTYKMHVEVSCVNEEKLATEEIGMVADFKRLKEVVKGEIVDPLDHAFMHWTGGNKAEKAIVESMKKFRMKVVDVDYRPTAEGMAYDFFQRMYPMLYAANMRLHTVKIWETQTSFATYSEEA